MPKLTKRFVESLRPTGKDRVVWDDKMLGFGLRVQPTGIRSYVVQYRNAQRRSRRLTIGKHGAVRAEGAREIARQILNEVHDRKDPRDPVAERRALVKAPTMNDLLDQYISEHVQKQNRPRTQEEIERLVARHIRPQLGKHKVAAVTQQDVAKLHRSLGSTPRQANFVLAVCSKAFGLAEVWNMRPDGSNPCRRIERYPESERERFLSAEELGRLGSTLRLAESDGLPWNINETGPKSKHLPKVENRRTVYSRVTTAAIQLLLLTGCRLSEVLNLEWKRVNYDDGTITLSGTKSDRMGNAVRQVVAMNAPARKVLKSLPGPQNSPWVLPSRNDPAHPLSKTAIEGAWQRIKAANKISDVRLHDLRHTVGTYAGQSGANAFLVRDLLRHKNLSMTGRYVNRAADPVRALSDQVGRQIAASLASHSAGQ